MIFSSLRLIYPKGKYLTRENIDKYDRLRSFLMKGRILETTQFYYYLIIYKLKGKEIIYISL